MVNSTVDVEVNNEMPVDNRYYVPNFYSLSGISLIDFKSREHLNNAMKDEVRCCLATPDDYIDNNSNSRDPCKCQTVMSRLFPKGRVFASVLQLQSMLNLVAESWGFIISRDGVQLK